MNMTVKKGTKNNINLVETMTKKNARNITQAIQVFFFIFLKLLLLLLLSFENYNTLVYILTRPFFRDNHLNNKFSFTLYKIAVFFPFNN